MNLTEKPKIAVINNLARSGGTLINRCIGCMDDIVLMSEIHPNIHRDRLIEQASEWYDFNLNIDPDEDWDFLNVLQMVSKQCADQSKSLVLRDWCYPDFIAMPFVSYPSNNNVLMNTLADHFEINSVAVIRHPIDQWLSLNNLAIFSKEKLPVAVFLTGYLNFLKNYSSFENGNGFIRYEDVVVSPDKKMTEICRKLGINFDSRYIEKWFDYDKITGDIFEGGRGYKKTKIIPMQRKPISRESMNRFLVQPQYKEILELSGYSVDRS